MRKIFTCLSLLAWLFKPTVSYAQVNMQDSLSLVNLYDSTDGSNWTNQTNWLTTASVSRWFGVTVNNSRVTALKLMQNNLTGNITAGLGNLTQLAVFDLSTNNLTGTIPSELGNLGLLNNLLLYNNQLSGSIPSSLGNLSQLTDLELEDNLLTGTIPSSLGNLSQLTNLTLYSNSLTGSMPSELGNLSLLQTMDLSSNQLTGIIPSSFGNLKNLTTLNLDINQLKGSIPSFGNLNHLQALILSTNQLSGSIPSSLGNLSWLQSMDLSTNQLTGIIPSELGNMSSLQYLILSSNQLSGSIPSALGNIGNLQYLDLSSNQFIFDGLEAIAQKFSFAIYSPQATIPLHFNSGKFSVSAGGTLSDESFQWYVNGILDTTIVGDSTFKINSPGNYYVAVNNSIATQLTLYSDTGFSALPVTLANFTGSLTNGNVVLNWETSQELNTSHFNVQRSMDGKHFITIDEVKAAGNSNVNRRYSYVDAGVTKLNVPDLFYHLQSVDIDYKVQISNVISINVAANNSQPVVFPNPANSIVNLFIPNGFSANSYAFIYDANGKMILEKNLNGSSNQQFYIKNLAQGNYSLVIIRGGKIVYKTELVILH